MRYLILAAAVLLIGGSANAGFLSSTRSAPPIAPPAFTMSGQKFLATGHNLFQSNGHNTRFSQ